MWIRILETRFSTKLDAVKWKFCAYLMKENIHIVQQLKIDEKTRDLVINTIKKVLKFHEGIIAGGAVDKVVAEALSREARSVPWEFVMDKDSSDYSAASEACSSAAFTVSFYPDNSDVSCAAEDASTAAAWAAVFVPARKSAYSSDWEIPWHAAREEAHKKYAKKLMSLLKRSKDS